MLAAERHFDKRAHSLGCHISQKIIGGSTADIVEILISSSPNHKLKESSILVWKVFVDNVEKTIPRFIVWLILSQLIQQIFIEQLLLEIWMWGLCSLYDGSRGVFNRSNRLSLLFRGLLDRWPLGLFYALASDLFARCVCSEYLHWAQRQKRGKCASLGRYPESPQLLEKEFVNRNLSGCELPRDNHHF